MTQPGTVIAYVCGHPTEPEIVAGETEHGIPPYCSEECMMKELSDPELRHRAEEFIGSAPMASLTKDLLVETVTDRLCNPSN